MLISPPKPGSPPHSQPAASGTRITADDPRIPAAVAGDRAAASALLTELLPRTRNLVRYLMRGDADVDDLAQNALIEVLRSLPSFRGESNLTTWADRITVRTVMRSVGRRQRDRELRARVEPELRAREPWLDAGDDYTERRRLALVMDTLPDAQRQAVVLHYVVGVSVPDMAEEIGVSFDTVKSRLRLGMERLRKHYLRERDDHD